MQTMKFSTNDIVIIRQALGDLPFIEWHILYLRFWENYSIQEIAIALEMKWDEVNMTIEKLLVQLKDYCMKDPAFSRSNSLTTSQQNEEEKYHEAV